MTLPVNADTRLYSVSILSIRSSILTAIRSDCVCASKSPGQAHISLWHSDSIAIFSSNCKLSLRTLKRISLSCIQGLPVPLHSIRFSSTERDPSTKRTPDVVDRLRRMLTRAGEREQVRETRSRSRAHASVSSRVRELYGKIPDSSRVGRP